MSLTEKDLLDNVIEAEMGVDRYVPLTRHKDEDVAKNAKAMLEYWKKEAAKWNKHLATWRKLNG